MTRLQEKCFYTTSRNNIFYFRCTHANLHQVVSDMFAYYLRSFVLRVSGSEVWFFSLLHAILWEFCLFVFWRYLIEKWRFSILFFAFHSLNCRVLPTIALFWKNKFKCFNLRQKFRAVSFYPQMKYLNLFFQKSTVIGKRR